MEFLRHTILQRAASFSSRGRSRALAKKIRPDRNFGNSPAISRCHTEPPRNCPPLRLILALAMLLAAGCTAPRRSFTPDVDPSALSDAAFLHYLRTAPVVTVDEGFRAVLMLNDREPFDTFELRFAHLQRTGAVRAEWIASPEQTLDMGTLAHLLMRMADVPPSLNDRIARRTGIGQRRYALRTCTDAGLLPHARPTDLVTGGQLLAAITRAQEAVESRAEQPPSPVHGAP